MRVIAGDLLELAIQGEFDVIVHGCNCHCTMGAGIAKQIKRRFPLAFEADLKAGIGANKLGSITYAAIDNFGNPFTIVNAYTQVHWRGDGVKVDYAALASAMREVKRIFGGKRIGYPKIGAGLAGGDWVRIAGIISEELDGEEHTLVEYAP